MNTFTLSEYLKMPNLASKTDYSTVAWAVLASLMAKDLFPGTAYKPRLNMTLSEVLMMRKN